MAVVKIVYDVDGLQDVQKADKAVQDLNKANDEATKSTKELDDAADDSAETMSGLGDEMKTTANRVSVFGVGLGDATGNIISMTKSARVLNTVLAALPLVAVAAGLASVATFLTQTKRGQDQLQVSTAKVNAALNVFRDRIAKAGEALLKTGDEASKSESKLATFLKTTLLTNPAVVALEASVNLLKKAFPGLTKEIQEEVVAAGELEAQSIANRDAQLELSVARAQANIEIEKAKFLAEDTTQSFEDRITAAQRAFDLENAVLTQEIELGQEAIKILERQQALGENTFEDNQELAELRISLAAAEQASATKQIEINNKINTIEKERIALSQQRQVQIDAEAEKERALNEIREQQAEARLQRDIDAIVELAAFQLEKQGELEEAELARRERDLENTELTENERALIIAESEDRINGIRQDAANKEKERLKALEDLRKAQLDTALSLIGEFAANSKPLALFEISLASAQAIAKGTAAAQSVPFPGNLLAIASTLAVIANNISRATQIANSAQEPQFAEGVINLQGPGTGTSDSISAKLSKGESVMTAKETFDFLPTLKAIRKNAIDPDVLNNLAIGMPSVIDATKVIEGRSVSLNLDSDGFTYYQHKRNQTIIKKNDRYKANVFSI